MAVLAGTGQYRSWLKERLPTALSRLHSIMCKLISIAVGGDANAGQKKARADIAARLTSREILARLPQCRRFFDQSVQCSKIVMLRFSL